MAYSDMCVGRVQLTPDEREERLRSAKPDPPTRVTTYAAADDIDTSWTCFRKTSLPPVPAKPKVLFASSSRSAYAREHSFYSLQEYMYMVRRIKKHSVVRENF